MGLESIFLTHPPHSIRAATDRGSKASPRRAQGRLASNRARGENQDEPQWPCLTLLRSGQGHLDLSRLILNLEPNPQNLHRGEANGPPEPIERLGHLPGDRLRSSGMPHEGSADLVSE